MSKYFILVMLTVSTWAATANPAFTSIPCIQALLEAKEPYGVNTEDLGQAILQHFGTSHLPVHFERSYFRDGKMILSLSLDLKRNKGYPHRYELQISFFEVDARKDYEKYFDTLYADILSRNEDAYFQAVVDRPHIRYVTEERNSFLRAEGASRLFMLLDRLIQKRGRDLVPRDSIEFDVLTNPEVRW